MCDGVVVSSRKGVKVRKPRRCFGCDTIFPIGSIFDVVANAADGKIESTYYCQICTLFWTSEDRYDDCIGPGELDDWFPREIENIFLNQEGISNVWPRERKK